MRRTHLRMAKFRWWTFALAFDGQHFTEQDVLNARIVEFVGTLGFDAQVLLAGSGFEPFLLELFREFGDSISSWS